MSQQGVDLETSLGYLLKEASSALRAAMEEVLRPLGMTVTHYSCLELLAQRPGLSNSELARGTFVTRQTMNVLLQALERDGYVTRPAEAPVGKVLPTRLTPRGRRSLEKASAAVRSVEERMLTGMTDAERTGAFRILQSMIHALRDSAGRVILRRVPKYYDELDAVLRALADPTRRAVVERLATSPAVVSELAEPFSMALPSLMQHLRILEDAGVVTSEKHGRVRTVSFRPGALDVLHLWLGEQRTPAEHQADRLGIHLTLTTQKEA